MRMSTIRREDCEEILNGETHKAENHSYHECKRSGEEVENLPERVNERGAAFSYAARLSSGTERNSTEYCMIAL